MVNTAKSLVLDASAAAEIDDWFKKLQNRRNDAYNGRAERAELRRAAAPYGALTCAGFQRLARRLSRLIEEADHRLLGVAMFAAVAVHAESNNHNKSFAAQLGGSVTPGSDRRYLSPLRFERLQRAATPEEFSRLLVRAVKIRGDAGVNLPSLADSILLWMDEWQARQNNSAPDLNPLRRNAVRWACEYGQTTQDAAP